MSQEITTQVVCGATLGLIAAGRLFIRGQPLNVSGYLRNVATLKHIALSKLLFLLGIAGAGVLLSANDSAALEPYPTDCPVWLAGLAGVLVGLGSSLAKGCDFGHGVSGAAALSLNSIIFVLFSLASARFSAVSFSHSSLLSPSAEHKLSYGQETVGLSTTLFIFAALAMAVSGFFGQKDDEEARRGVSAAPQNFALYAGDIAEGILFAYAAALGGYAKPSVVIAGLSFGTSAFKPSLLYILTAALVGAFPAYMSVFRILKPSHSFSGAKNSKLATSFNVKTLIGGVLFGSGWGIGGLSPVSALMNLPLGSPAVMVFFVSLMSVYIAFESAPL